MNNGSHDDEAFDLDGLLDHTFITRQVPVLSSPSLGDVRRRARRRGRTRVAGLVVVTCASVGGVAVLASSHRTAPTRVAIGEAGADQPCVVATTVLVGGSDAPTTTIYDTTVPTDAPDSLPDGIAYPSTTYPASTYVVDPCLAGQPGAFRCSGASSISADGWTYFDYCEQVDGIAPATVFSETTLPIAVTTPTPTTTEGIGTYTVVFGDYLFDIANRFCETADFLAEFNGWPEGVDHPLNPGDLVVIPGRPDVASCPSPYPTTTVITDVTVDPSVPPTTTTGP